MVEMPEMRVLTLYITLTQPLDLAGHSSGGGGVSPLPLPLPKGSAHQGSPLYFMEMPEMAVLTEYIKFNQPVDLGGHGSGGRGAAPLPLPLHQRFRTPENPIICGGND